MDLLQTVRKEGSRGGRSEFKWQDVKDSQHRENYLGHSLMAPVGRWQQGRDLNWYAKAGDSDHDQAEARREELRKVKQAEEDAMARALGIDPPQRPENNANLVELGPSRDEKRLAGGTPRRDDEDDNGDRRRDRQHDRHGRDRDRRRRLRSRSREHRGRERRERHGRHGSKDRHHHRKRRSPSRDRRRSTSPSRDRTRDRLDRYDQRDRRERHDRHERSERHNRSRSPHERRHH